MPLFADPTPTPFWNRRALLFAAGGLFAYVVSLALFEIRSAVVLVLAGMVRLVFGVAAATFVTRRFGWGGTSPWYSGLLAAPYPLELALFVWGKRFAVLPRGAILAISGPAAFLGFLTVVLLISRWTTTWALPAAVREQQAEPLRLLGGLLLVLTAVGVILVPAEWSLAFLHYAVEPVALIGYCAIVGR